MTVVNAIIESAGLVNKDYLSLYLNLKLANNGCTCFGNTCIGHYNPADNISEEDGQNNYAAYYIEKVFEVAGVHSFKNLQGQPLRAIFDNKVIIGIQHFLDDGIFFIPRLPYDSNLNISSIFTDEWNERLWSQHSEEWKWSQKIVYDNE